MTSDLYTPELLRKDLSTGKAVLVLDCRSQNDHTKSHIASAINVTMPSLMLKRLKKGTLNISCVIQNNEAKDRFHKCRETHHVVIYDESSSDVTANPSSIINLLLRKLKSDGYNTSFLLGGFSTFKERFPEYCSIQDDDPEETILGLCNLKIAEQPPSPSGPSSGSANFTPPLLSPFPVKVLSNLYLGNAKNSADLAQLKKYGIKYILNVTPNVPNMYEMDESFKYMQIPISDHWSQNLSSFFPEAIAFIDDARQNNHGVLVHCLAGISRSVTVTVAYLMQKEGMSLNEAYDFVKNCKPNISPNFNFMGQLLDFEHSLSPTHDGSSSKCSHEINHFLLSNTTSETTSNFEVDVRPA